ncbi:MAG: carboxypeptidase-like regulatory domain-containing protein [Bryobacteraceae bacterium]
MPATISRRCLILALAAGLIAAAAEADDPSGIDGFVTAELTASVPGARIGIDSLSKGFHRETTTDVTGYYLMDDLTPGAYSIWAEVRGLGCIIYPRVALLPGKHVRQDFRFVRTKRYPGACDSVKR